jgi:hypothetical protein
VQFLCTSRAQMLYTVQAVLKNRAAVHEFVVWFGILRFNQPGSNDLFRFPGWSRPQLR